MMSHQPLLSLKSIGKSMHYFTGMEKKMHSFILIVLNGLLRVGAGLFDLSGMKRVCRASVGVKTVMVFGTNLH